MNELGTARVVALASIAAVLVAIVALIVVLLLRGLDTSAPAMAGLVSFIGLLVGMLGGLVAQRQVATFVGAVGAQVADVQDKVNGHMRAHVGHTEEQLRTIIREELKAAALPPRTGGD